MRKDKIRYDAPEVRNLCSHIRVSETEQSDAYHFRNHEAVKAGILRVLTPVECLHIKNSFAFQFRQFWEADHRVRAEVPDDQRGMATMAGGLYCHEHRLLVIPLKHPLIEPVATMIVVPDIDLPDLSGKLPEPEPEKPNPRVKQW